MEASELPTPPRRGLDGASCNSRFVDERKLAVGIAGLPADLKVWFDGPAALPRLLVESTMRRYSEVVLDLRAAGSLVNSAAVHAMRDGWRHSVTSLVEWHGLYGHTEARLVPLSSRDASIGSRPVGRRRTKGQQSLRPLGRRDYAGAVNLSRSWLALDTIRAGLASGDLGVTRWRGRHVWLTNSRNPAIEALDVLLAQVTVFDPPAPDPKTQIVDEWFRANAHLGAAGAMLNAMPARIRESAWADTEATLEVQGLSLPESTDLGGLTLGEARTCYAYLIMQLRLNELAAYHFQSPEALLWGIRPINLVRVLSSRVDGRAAAAFVDLLRFRKGRSPISAPLIPHGEMVLIPAEIVSPIAFERTLLRAAAASPSAVGQLGNTLGRRSSRWAERLGSVPGCEVATELRVLSSEGRPMGDLDVVAWDPLARVMLIVETKWPVDAATLAESFKVDAMVDKGRAQLARLRTCIEDGTCTVSWPRHWDVATMGVVAWWVGTAQQLDSRRLVDDAGIRVTSLRMIEQLLPAESLGELIVRLADFPLPQSRVDFSLKSTVVQAGELTIHFKTLALLGDPPVPPPGRHSQDGWT